MEAFLRMIGEDAPPCGSMNIVLRTPVARAEIASTSITEDLPPPVPAMMTPDQTPSWS
jgi:hypothetical protein